MAAGTLPLEGAINIDLGMQLNVMSGDFEHKNTQALLFSDGSIFDGIPRLHLDDFDVEKSRKEAPRNWGEWQSDGDAPSIRWNDENGVPGDWKIHESWFRFQGPTGGETLAGTYEKLDVTSLYTGSRELFATGWKTVTFNENGTFAESSGGSTSSGASNLSSTDGYLSIVSAHADSTKGKYQITDNAIKFTFDDGSERENSIFYSTSEKKVILINGVKFIRG